MSPTTHSRQDISPELVLVDPELRRVAQLLLPEPGALAAAARAEVPRRSVQAPPVLIAAQPRRSTWVGRGLAASMVAAAALVAWSTAVSPAGQRPTLVAAGPAPTSPPGSSGGRPESDARRALAESSQRPPRADVKRAAAQRSATSTPDRKPKRPNPQTVPSRTAPAKTPAARKAAPAPRAPRVTKVSSNRPLLSWRAVRGASYYNVIVWRRGQRVLDLWPTANKAVLPRTWSYAGKGRSLSPGTYFWFVYPGFGAKADARYGDVVRTGILVVERK